MLKSPLSPRRSGRDRRAGAVCVTITSSGSRSRDRDHRVVDDEEVEVAAPPACTGGLCFSDTDFLDLDGLDVAILGQPGRRRIEQADTSRRRPPSASCSRRRDDEIRRADGPLRRVGEHARRRHVRRIAARRTARRPTSRSSRSPRRSATESSLNFWMPTFFSMNHGGISRVSVFCLMLAPTVARPRT